MFKVVEKTWNEFWAKYWRIDHRHRYPGIFDWDRQLVTFIENVCQLSPGDRILDLGCGGGDQAKVFAQRGYKVVGIDIAPSLIEFAKQQFKKEGLEGTFIVGDMRAIDYDSEFDACVILSGTFGIFGDSEDQELLYSICRALKVGGKVFIMLVHQPDKHSKTWIEIKDGWQLSEIWFDTETSTYRSRYFIIRKDGTLLQPKTEPGYHANEIIRCYTIPEIRTMLLRAGLQYIDSYSDTNLSVPPKKLAPETVRNIVVAKRLNNLNDSNDSNGLND
jgi:cyclopropane fatty-acyl-phospholipid synthase-like methyltransferase